MIIMGYGLVMKRRRIITQRTRFHEPNVDDNSCAYKIYTFILLTLQNVQITTAQIRALRTNGHFHVSPIEMFDIG